MNCSTCEFWLYHFPNKAGVCTVGPDRPEGYIGPVTVELCGDGLAHQYEESIATMHDTSCYAWEPSESFLDAVIDEDEEDES